METIKRFENGLGYAEIIKCEEGYMEKMESKMSQVGHCNIYPYKQDAIASYQFDCGWLERNEKNC